MPDVLLVYPCHLVLMQVSAIINVDQEVEDDWELLILDHDDNEHRLVMQPGDMVLYESAKLLHGRPGRERAVAWAGLGWCGLGSVCVLY